jgi:integrase
LTEDSKNLSATETKTVAEEIDQQTRKQDAKVTQYAWKSKLKGIAENTTERRCYVLQRLVNDGADLNNPDNVEEVLATKEYPTATKWLAVHAYHSYCKMFRLEWEPVKVKYTPKTTYLPSEEGAKIFIGGFSKQLKSFLQVLFETGCRCGEAVKIEWTDISEEPCRIHIAHPEKGSNERTNQVSRTLIDLLKTLPKKYGKNIFNPNLATLRDSFMGRRKKIAVESNKPEWLRIHFHTFRHLRGTLDKHNGVDVFEIKDNLGHKCIASTEKYVHWNKQLFHEGNDKYYTLTAATDEEADRAIEAGWQFVYFNPDTKRTHFRKAK